MPTTREARWRRKLREATGRGVRIGILDTGVADHELSLKGVVRSHCSVSDSGRIMTSLRGSDSLGHGTACAWIVKSLAPDAELHSVRIFGRSARERGEKLITGLGFAIERGWDIINVSLGTSGFREELTHLANLAAERGIVIIAAASNAPGKSSFPAELPNVIGVDAATFDSPLAFRYRDDHPIQVEASGVYVRAPWPNGEFSHFTGSSFACPHVTAIAARLGQGRIDELSGRLRQQLAALSL
ncbi:MAG: S8 family serine peptidase [Verrucomicrobiae bacterium]|nr:S8 family serine peptidase [Verrucomicrobiae bacterium]